MGKPLRKPLPIFSGVINESRISTRSSGPAETSRLLNSLTLPSKEFRSMGSPRKSSATLTTIDPKQSAQTSRPAGVGVTRNIHTRKHSINDEKVLPTSPTSPVTENAPSSKRLRPNDNLHVLRNLNRDDVAGSSGVPPARKKTYEENSVVTRRPKATNVQSKVVSSSRLRTTMDSDSPRYDQNVSPQPTAAISSGVQVEQSEQGPSSDNKAHQLRRGRRQSKRLAPVSTLSRRKTRHSLMRYPLIPAPALVQDTKEFQIPMRRQSARIQEHKKEPETSTSTQTLPPSPPENIRQVKDIEIPKFRYIGPPKPVKLPPDLFFEDLSDEAFLKRHEKREIEERRAKKIDLREQREQAFRERMLRKQMGKTEPSPPPPPRFNIIQIIGNGRPPKNRDATG